MNRIAKALTRMFHTPRPAGGSFLLRRTRFDYRKEIGDGLDSSVVTAPIRWVQRALPEATLVVRQRRRDGTVEELTDHQLVQLIQRPNPYYGDIALWAGTALSWYLGGNAYWLKVRNGAGRVKELWYVPHWMMEPKGSEDGSEFLTHYVYRPGGGLAPMRVEPEDVVHFRDGLDPRNMRMGISSLDGVIREIFMDLEASNFVASLLRNMGVPGVIISPKTGVMPTPDDVEATKAWIQASFGGDRRGSAMVMGAATDVQQFGFNPQQMNMSEARDIAEERVCACIGIPAAVVGFGAGLQTAKVGATMEELRKIAWHNGVLPVARAFADEIQRSLLPDFGPTTGLTVGWDTAEVLALQDDEDKETERWNRRVQGGWAQVFEAREAAGLDADDSHRIYLRPINLIEVPADGRAPAAQVVPPGPGKSGQKARASEEAVARGEAYALLLQRQARGLEKAFEARLTAFFGRLGEAAGKAAAEVLALDVPKAGKGTKGTKGDESLVELILGKLGLKAWMAELTQSYGAHYLEVATQAAEIEGGAAEGAGLGTGLPDPVARAIVAAGGKRVGLIDLDGQTRQAIFEALAEGRAEGEGVQALADRIELFVDGGPWSGADVRARIIARTETKYAQNLSTIERARAAGVGKLMIFDGRLGPGRSLESHMARNGEIVSIDEALVMAGLEHPNGTLSFAPHFDV